MYACTDLNICACVHSNICKHTTHSKLTRTSTNDGVHPSFHAEDVHVRTCIFGMPVCDCRQYTPYEYFWLQINMAGYKGTWSGQAEWMAGTSGHVDERWRGRSSDSRPPLSNQKGVYGTHKPVHISAYLHICMYVAFTSRWASCSQEVCAPSLLRHPRASVDVVCASAIDIYIYMPLQCTEMM